MDNSFPVVNFSYWQLNYRIFLASFINYVSDNSRSSRKSGSVSNILQLLRNSFIRLENPFGTELGLNSFNFSRSKF